MKYQFKTHLSLKIILDKDIIQIFQIICEFERTKSRKVIFKIRSWHRYQYLSYQVSAILSYIFYKISFNSRYNQKIVRFEDHSTFILINSIAHRHCNSKRQILILHRLSRNEFEDDVKSIYFVEIRYNLPIDRARDVLLNIEL